MAHLVPGPAAPVALPPTTEIGSALAMVQGSKDRLRDVQTAHGAIGAHLHALRAGLDGAESTLRRMLDNMEGGRYPGGGKARTPTPTRSRTPAPRGPRTPPDSPPGLRRDGSRRGAAAGDARGKGYGAQNKARLRGSPRTGDRGAAASRGSEAEQQQPVGYGVPGDGPLDNEDIGGKDERRLIGHLRSVVAHRRPVAYGAVRGDVRTAPVEVLGSLLHFKGWLPVAYLARLYNLALPVVQRLGREAAGLTLSNNRRWLRAAHREGEAAATWPARALRVCRGRGGVQRSLRRGSGSR